MCGGCASGLLRLAVLQAGLTMPTLPKRCPFRRGSAIFLPLWGTYVPSLTYQSCGWSSIAWGPASELGPCPENYGYVKWSNSKDKDS